ncbi:hypothetical protein EBZ39_01615 [bacterium]|nr:hypothetical protein [bacterium]
MKLTAQEAQLAYEALRVVNTALGARKVELIREYNAAFKGCKEDPYLREPSAFDELGKTFDVQDAIVDLLLKFERAVEKPAKKRKPKDGKNERRT